MSEPDVGEPRPRPPAAQRADRDAALAGLFRALGEAPREHDFFAVLRLSRPCARSRRASARALRPAQEVVRLGQDPELDFAPSALESFSRRRREPRRASACASSGCSGRTGRCRCT